MTELPQDEREYLLKVLQDESMIRRRQGRRLQSRVTALEDLVSENTGETKRLSMMVHRIEKRSRWNRMLLGAAVFAAPHIDPMAVWRFVLQLF